MDEFQTFTTVNSKTQRFKSSKILPPKRFSKVHLFQKKDLEISHKGSKKVNRHKKKPDSCQVSNEDSVNTRKYYVFKAVLQKIDRKKRQNRIDPFYEMYKNPQRKENAAQKSEPQPDRVAQQVETFSCQENNYSFNGLAEPESRLKEYWSQRTKEKQEELTIKPQDKRLIKMPDYLKEDVPSQSTGAYAELVKKSGVSPGLTVVQIDEELRKMLLEKSKRKMRRDFRRNLRLNQKSGPKIAKNNLLNGINEDSVSEYTNKVLPNKAASHRMRQKSVSIIDRFSSPFRTQRITPHLEKPSTQQSSRRQFKSLVSFEENQQYSRFAPVELMEVCRRIGDNEQNSNWKNYRVESPEKYVNSVTYGANSFKSKFSDEENPFLIGSFLRSSATKKARADAQAKKDINIMIRKKLVPLQKKFSSLGYLKRSENKALESEGVTSVFDTKIMYGFTPQK